MNEATVIDQARIRDSLDALAVADPDVARGIAHVGYPLPRIRPHGFSTLLNIVAGQQISTEAARAILDRLDKLMGGEVTAERFLALDEEALRGAGLSRRKVEYARGAAEAVMNGTVPVAELTAMSDEEVIERITSLRGFGKWSAEIYCLFSLGRGDVFPADDMALQEALKRLKRLDERPDGKSARRIVEPWSPYRGIAAIFLWHTCRARSV